MFRQGYILLAGVVLIATGATATAMDGGGDRDPNAPKCGESFVLTKGLAREAAHSDGYGHEGTQPVFLTGARPGQSMPDEPPFVFAKPDGWVGINGEPGHGLQGVFTAPDGGAVLISMWEVGGPGHDFMFVTTQDGFAHVACSRLEFPDEVEQPGNWMKLVDFNLDENGRGVLIGGADFEEGNVTHWYRYETKDGAKTWSGPEMSMKKPAALSGVYVPIKRGDTSELKSDLVDSLR